MDFYAVLEQVLAVLRGRGRVPYRALKLQLQLDDDAIEALKDELIYAQHVAVDEDGRVLVWTGGAGATPAPVLTPGLSGPSDRQVDLPADVTPRPAGARIPEAERRQLTVLFCDLVDSTALANRLDPEEWREVVRAYQSTCAEVIQRFEGHIAQYLGDGLLIYFGYPLAHEDDAQRAVRAALGMVDALGQLNARLVGEWGIQVAVRVGIHTGLVVVGEMGAGARHESLALGETPNVAARLQDLAAPDSVVISATTFRLIQGLFECQELGPQTLKGVTTPVLVYRVIGESGAQSRLEVAGPTGLTPLVGREQEVGLLLERWTQVKEGGGQVVLLSGEAGIGKSRLVQVLKDHVAHEPHLRWECRCSPYYQNSAFYPLIELWHRVLRLTSEDSPDEKLRKLEEALAPYHVSLPEVVPWFAALLSLPLPDRYPPLSLSPQRQKQKTLEAVLRVLQALAARQPVLFIVEDLHWGDPSTLELLSLLIDQGQTVRILTLLVFRPEFHPPWGFCAHVTPLTLVRLPQHQTEVMVTRVARGKGLPAEVRRQIVAKTDGVPLFVEELTKMVLESSLLQERDDRYELRGPLPPLAIPTTLQDSLMARLDRLAPVKEVAQLGAILGRAFPYELLRAVAPQDEATLQYALARLVEVELLYQRGVPPRATYIFKHVLIQEAAYQSLLKSRRQHYHQRIAQVLAEQFPEMAETQPELFAHHYTEAGLSEQAIGYWQRAGQRAIERSANVEAISHLTKGLELLKTLPDTPERLQQELLLQTTLGPALMATQGYGAPEVERVYARALELCRQVGESPQLFPVLAGLRRFHLVRGELQMALEVGEQFLSLAQRAQDPALLLEAHSALAITLLFLGEFAPAREHADQGMALYDPQQHRVHAFFYGPHPGVVCLSYAAWALWFLGYPDKALERSHESLTLARGLSHPHSLVYALHHATLIPQLRREGKAAKELAEAVITLSTEQEYPFWIAAGTIMRGWALAEQGQAEEGMAQIRQGMTAKRATGTRLAWPYWLALLAEACWRAGKADEGLTALTEALAAVHRSGERSYEAEVYRLKGELLLMQVARSGGSRTGPTEPSMVAKANQSMLTELEACFRQALDIARRQRAKSLELRAVLSLSRLWRDQGRCEEARQLLAGIYSWFTEGLDTADLQEARALLEAVSRA
jgi:TOMM system kinase/cyclase fusion protein